MEVTFADVGRQISPTSTFIDFKEHKERIMEVKFAAAGRQISQIFTYIDVDMKICPCAA